MTEEEFEIIRGSTYDDTYKIGFRRGYDKAGKEVCIIVIFYALSSFILGCIIGFGIAKRLYEL